MSTRIHTKIAKTITAALVIAAVAAPIAQSSSTPKVDPLAVSYLIGQGLSPSEVTSWTTGACSHQVKAASCHAMLDRSATSTKAVDPLAVGYLIGQGLSPSEVTSWTTGACSHQVKAASCHAMFKPATTSTPVADSAKGVRVQIPPSLANFREPGSTGYVPQVTTTGTAPQMRALILRAQALNRLYGNAWTRISPAEFTSLVKAFGASVTTTMSPQQARAELARGQGLNRLTNFYEPGSTGYAPKTTLVTNTSPVGGGLDWISALIGAGAGLGIAVAVAGVLMMASRKHRTLVHV